MTSRERVLAALNHQVPDRPPLNYFGTPETTAKLLSHLHLDTHEELLRYFGADMRYVSSRYIGPETPSSDEDMWGVVWKSVRNNFCTYSEVAYHPLAEARTLKELEAYPWPSPDWMSVAHLKEEIRAINQDEPRAIVLPTGSFFETAWYLRGFQQLLMDMLDQPDLAEFLLMKVTGFFKEVTMRAVEAADGQIDLVWSSSDVGIQKGMMFSPELWREKLKPCHRELIEPFKQMGLKTRYHSDGSVFPIIEDLIEMGLDLLDPIQPNTKGMEAENLKAHFEGRISFYGGVDTQRLLPYGSAREVEDEVLRLIRILGAKGGYVAAASNAVQPDVPIDNILTLYRTAREYRY